MHLKTIIFVAGIATGIIAGEGSVFGSEIAVASLILATLQTVIYLIGRKSEAEGFALPLFIFLFSIGTFLGIFRAQLEQEKKAFVCESSCTFDAEIVASPEMKDAYQTIIVHPLETSSDTYDVQLRVPLYPKFTIGETVNVSGKVSVPKPLYPHGGKQAFDYATYLHTKHIGSEALFPKVKVIDEEVHTFTAILGRWKEDMIERINLHVSSPAASLASGMLFGNADMSKELTSTFRTAGLSHIVVLSGFNIAIVISFILFVLAFLPLVLRIALASVSVILFVLMVGVEASVARATLMALIALLATLISRAYVARQALIVSLLAIILYDPQALSNDVSLHLSFLATAGIIYLSDTIKNITERFISQKSFVELCATTFAAYFATFPYVCFVFGTVSPYALVANILALPFVPLAMLLSFATVIFSYLSHASASLFGFADTVVIGGIVFIAKGVERLPLSRFEFTTSALGMMAMYAAFLCALYYAVRKINNETHQTNKQGHLTGNISY